MAAGAVELPSWGGSERARGVGEHVRRPSSGRARDGSSNSRHRSRISQLASVQEVARLRRHAICGLMRSGRRRARARQVRQPICAGSRGPRDVCRGNRCRVDQQPLRADRACLRRDDHARASARRRRRRRRGDDLARHPLRGNTRSAGDQPEPRVRHLGHLHRHSGHRERDRVRSPARCDRRWRRRQRLLRTARVSRRGPGCRLRWRHDPRPLSGGLLERQLEARPGGPRRRRRLRLAQRP